MLEPPRVGKTHLAVSLGLKAIEADYRILFSSAAHLIATLTKAQGNGRHEENHKLYMPLRWLVIDDTGYLPIARQRAHLFFQLLSRCYKRGPMVLTSTQSFGLWGELFEDRDFITANLHRLLRRTIALNICGNSHRLKETLQDRLVRSHDNETQPGREIQETNLGNVARPLTPALQRHLFPY